MIELNTLNGKCLKWFVLYTSPRAEKQVIERLRSQDIKCWVPLHKSPRVWSDRVKIVEIPLFSSYVFVNCLESELHGMLRTYGVARIVFYDGRPAVIRDKEIESIKDFLVQSANHPLMVGEEVEILAGAMKNISGQVRTIKKTYIVLYLEQLGATVSVNIENVAPIKRIK
ncbi:MAG: UpxY family transcription antiterminator [Tannerellaceae bacterium]|jgi:transcription antitermination factor NusG|nr:UpxY family transcription antiterminator [Tannerellaceae bacterium]